MCRHVGRHVRDTHAKNVFRPKEDSLRYDLTDEKRHQPAIEIVIARMAEPWSWKFVAPVFFIVNLGFANFLMPIDDVEGRAVEQ